MPAYRTHVTLNLFLGLPLTLAAIKYTVLTTPIDTISFVAAFIYGTFFLHPDLDLARQTRLFSLKGLLTLPFRPYSYLFHHRGISHMPLIGTLTRVLWLIVFFGILFSCFDWAYPDIIPWDAPYVWFGLAGLTVADLFHVLLDRLVK
jgi:uncharacterized metal-binding protein